MIAFDHTWSSATSTGAQATMSLNGCDADSWRALVEASSGTATTGAIQVSLSTVGPWISIVSTSVSSGAMAAMDFSGPLFGVVRGYSGSTGATIRLVGVAG